MNLIDLLRGNNTVPSANLLFSLINSRHWSGSDELDVCLLAVLDLHITDLDMYDSYSPLFESYIIIYHIWLTNTYWRRVVLYLQPLALAVLLHMALVAGGSTLVRPTRTKELTPPNLSHCTGGPWVLWWSDILRLHVSTQTAVHGYTYAQQCS